MSTGIAGPPGGFTMKIYRLEHLRSKKGPYYHAAIYNDPLCTAMTQAHSDKPHPCADFALRPEDLMLYRFGCPTAELLENWFEGWLPRLGLMGFVVRELEIGQEHVLLSVSGLQVAVHRNCGVWG